MVARRLVALLSNFLTKNQEDIQMFIFENGGQSHLINGKNDMLNALGLQVGRPTFMTNEAGEIVGIGHGVANLTKSIPLIKAIKDAQPLHKPGKKLLVKATKQTATLAKGGFSINKLKSAVAELEVLAKAHIA
jgi:hypothetical protein